jgi:magnesium transporter
MIKYYQRTVKDNKLKKLDEFQIGSLIYVSDPSDDEVKFISKRFGLEEGLIMDALDPYESPRMEIKKNVAYIFSRIPEPKESLKQTSTFPVMFSVGKDFLMIISRKNPDFLISIVDKRKKYFTTQRTKLFLRLFSEVEGLYSDLLNKINKRINYFSLNVGNFKDQDIANFINYEVILNDFINALLPLRHVLTKILGGKTLELYQDDKELVEDLQLNNEQLIERSKSNLTNIVNIRQAHEVISTNRLNRVMKVLTVSTVILALPTMITSFYGMNVHLPYDKSANAYWGIIVSIFIAVAVLLFFLRKKHII